MVCMCEGGERGEYRFIPKTIYKEGDGGSQILFASVSDYLALKD